MRPQLLLLQHQHATSSPFPSPFSSIGVGRQTRRTKPVAAAAVLPSNLAASRRRGPFSRGTSNTSRVAMVVSAAPSGEKHSTSISDVGLPRAAVVGVLGGGQLGRMLAQEAVKMGVRLRVLDPTTAGGDGRTPGCPAAAAAQQTLGSFTDPDDVAAFAASGVDILTVEIEHVDADALEKVARASGVDVEPTPATLRLIQDKLGQKRHFAAAGVAVADHASVPDLDAAAGVGERFGYPFMLKARRGAYDGKGNAVVASREGVEAAARSLGGFETGNLYAERWAPFSKELAVMVARSRSGEVLPFPVVETVHRDSICWVTEAPADVPSATREAASAAAAAAVAALDGAGVFGVEMFLLPDGSLLLNEVAPRPHNSGHYTIEACVTSQFEQHLRAVLGWPLGDPSLRGSGGSGNGGGANGDGKEEGSESAIMLNILGAADGDAGVAQAHETMAKAYATPGASVHWYGKDGVAKGRKVGHVTILGRSRAEARARLAGVDAEAALALERSSPSRSPSAAASVAAAAAAAAPSSSSSSFTSANMFPPTTARVGIIMGSDSDLPTMAAARDALLEFGVEAEVTVVSAHRTPDRMVAYAREAASRGLRVIIAGAGGAAHLPGMVAAMTPLPVVGVPVVPTSGGRLDGLDALLSIVQMPRGVPVATVAIGNAANAGLLAARILGCAEGEGGAALRGRMEAWQLAQRDVVLDKAERLERGGVDSYLGRNPSNRGSPGGGGDNGNGEPRARRPYRRTGRPRPLLPRSRVDDATGALVILFDDVAVATVGVDGAVAFDTRELFAKSAAEPPPPPPPPVEVDEDGKPVGRRGRRPETGNKARSNALRGALNRALAAAGLQIVTAAQAAAAAAGAGGGDAAAVRPREAISAVAAEGTEAVLDQWLVLLSPSAEAGEGQGAKAQQQVPFVDGMVLPAVAGRMAAVKDALQAAFEDQEARKAARDARIAAEAAAGGGGEAMAVE